MNSRVFVGTEQSSKIQDGASQQHMNEKCDYDNKKLYGGSYFTVLHQQEQYLKFIYYTSFKRQKKFNKVTQKTLFLLHIDHKDRSAGQSFFYSSRREQ